MSLEKLSNQELLIATKVLVKKERALTHLVLEHLAEVEIRKLYADLKYSSLYDYCMRELGYSEDESYRRISAMRFLKRNPTVTRNLTLSTLNLLDKFQKITPPSRPIEEIANSLSGKSKKEVEATLFPSKNIAPAPDKVKLTVNDSTYQKLLKLSAMSGKSVDDLLDCLLEKELNKNIAKIKQVPTNSDKKSRYIPIAIRTHAIRVADGKCQNCGSIYRLEFNHKIPFAKSGERSIQNINLLCRSCNQRQMVKDFGDKIRREFF